MIVSKAQELSFKLETDPEDVASITVRQVAFGASRVLAELTATQRQVLRGGPKGDTVAYEQDYNRLDEMAQQIFLTAVAIDGISDEEGKPLFEFVDRKGIMRPKNREAFLIALDQLPTDTIVEMHKYVLEVNPQWAAVPNAQG